MKVYTGDPRFDFIFVSTERGPSRGLLVGMNRSGFGEWPLPMTEQWPHLTGEWRNDIDAYAATRGWKIEDTEHMLTDGEHVFHGKPRLAVADTDFTDVFGPGLESIEKKKFDEFRVHLEVLLPTVGSHFKFYGYIVPKHFDYEINKLWELARS